MSEEKKMNQGFLITWYKQCIHNIGGQIDAQSLAGHADGDGSWLCAPVLQLNGEVSIRIQKRDRICGIADVHIMRAWRHIIHGYLIGRRTTGSIAFITCTPMFCTLSIVIKQ